MSVLYAVNINGSEIQVEKGTLLRDIAAKYSFKYPVLAAEVNNEVQELHKPVLGNCSVKFLDMTENNGFRIYQRSLIFLMVYAVKRVLGNKTRVVVEHSINKNQFCKIIGVDVTQSGLDEIEAVMKDAVSLNLPIEKLSLPLEEAVKISEEFELLDKVQSLKYRRTANVSFYRLDNFYDYFYGALAPSAGCLVRFRLLAENGGFFVNLASQSDPETFAEIKTLKKITQVFNESTKWSRILKTHTVGALNEKICAGEGGDVVRVNEALHEKRLANIADLITEQKKHIVLVAGPSSSGKTTFSRRLSIQLHVNGFNPHVISLDDYYVDRDKTPLDEFGQLDFESVEALDFAQINEDLSGLLDGKTVQIPVFNFISGKREYKGRFLKLGENDILIIEGLHGINDRLTANIPRDKKFKIFIGALTQLNIDDHNRIPTSDTRMIRRMVRDNQFRGFSAKKTINMWESVMRGEAKNIFPFQEDADAIFNSALVYEMSVLKLYAEPLLFNISKAEREYAEARRLVKFLDCFIGIPSDDVPNNSIIREFIGGSCFRT